MWQEVGEIYLYAGYIQIFPLYVSMKSIPPNFSDIYIDQPQAVTLL